MVRPDREGQDPPSFEVGVFGDRIGDHGSRRWAESERLIVQSVSFPMLQSSGRRNGRIALPAAFVIRRARPVSTQVGGVGGPSQEIGQRCGHRSISCQWGTRLGPIPGSGRTGIGRRHLYDRCWRRGFEMSR